MSSQCLTYTVVHYEGISQQLPSFSFSLFIIIIYLFIFNSFFLLLCVPVPQLTDSEEIQRCLEEARSRIALGTYTSKLWLCDAFNNIIIL